MSQERPYLVKLVRDDVGRFLGGGNLVTYKPVPWSEHVALLRQKLIEEAVEYLVKPSLGELADIYEVIRALADVDLGLDEGGPEAIAVVVEEARAKRRERGGFTTGMGMYCTTTASERHESERGL